MRTLKQLIITLTLALACAVAPAAPPLIGINMGVTGPSPDDSKLSLDSTYVDAITSAGGIPLLLPAARDPEAIDRYVALCDGFLMTGGPDINPARFNETTHDTARLMSHRRDKFDFALIDAILKSGKPILGVCLGSQELNVALGGSMIQDIPSETSSTIDHRTGRFPAHIIEITTGSMLRDLLGTSTLQVNSIHHQACDRLGSGVLVMARAPDGIVESFKIENKPFALGVQWHPEKETSIPEHLAIYQALINAAK